MADDVLVKVEGVSKKFCRSLKRSLWYGVQDIATEMLGRKDHHDELRKNEFWAVEDVSFELRRGECLGLIGPNGAGKSTLLKMLNGLVKPDKGRITMRGRVGALIELGAGFNPILTARENIYINGSVLGFSKKEIDRKFDSIVDFAEIEEFVDTPVQSYSSGMKVRLGFAVAVQMKPDILLVDEILAVGDVGFRAKSFGRVAEIQSKCAVIFVSHQMPQVARISDRVFTMKQGLGREYSEKGRAISEYLRQVRKTKVNVYSNEAQILSGRIKGANLRSESQFDFGDELLLEFEVSLLNPRDEITFNLHFLDESDQYVYQVNSKNSGLHFREVIPGRYLLSIRTPPIKLNAGIYSCALSIRDEQERTFLGWSHGIVPFEITGTHMGVTPYQDRADWNLRKQSNSTEV